MDIEFDCDLTPDQWEALKALRQRVTAERPRSRHILESLVALDLVSIDGGLPVMTARGRRVLIRGSSRLLDVAA
ncbi:hypothetical protein [Bradyrhizobium sp.]|uniref:hypothetical protein n=1 Tax=Bradyrhizobium sp. TaxID=376 RepID=UPI001D272A09|nr:hypothetical protein [Bradyrhizobium sp.]MBI5318679.1 hypothetical protein [Bradyrhizobium sp.]